MYYYEARYYDAKIGRFTGIDPWFGDLSDPQSLNKYAYVRNNPLKYVDPTGEAFEQLQSEINKWGSSVENWFINLTYDTPIRETAKYVVQKNVYEKRGWKTTANMLSHSFQDNPEKWVRGNDSYVAEQIKASSEYKDGILTHVKNVLKDGKLKDEGSLAFDSSSDLHNSIGKFNYSFSAVENGNGSFNLDINIIDNYDFHATAAYTSDLEAAFANAAGYSCQLTDILNTYDVQVNLKDTVEMDNNEDEDKNE